jgi:hypothetical protein
MGSQMTHGARAELANAVRRRYHAASGKAERRILDEFIATTGYHEKSAIRLLNQRPAVRPRQTRRRLRSMTRQPAPRWSFSGRPRIVSAGSA